MLPIEIRDVTFEYDSASGKVTAVEHVSFNIDASEFLCIVGQSGCGKSTLLNIIAGFLTPTAGEVMIAGKPITGHGMDRGVVFQDFAQLFPWRTALGNVAFGLEMKGIPREEREQIAHEQLRLVKLESFASSYPHHLSGGMQQRVAIARALAYNPAILLMDEPFAALDALTREEMQRLLADVWRATRKTVVYVTHNVAEAVYLADRVIVMSAHPGTVKDDVRIPLDRPRDPLSPDFLDWQKVLLGKLVQDTHGSDDHTIAGRRPSAEQRRKSDDDMDLGNEPATILDGNRCRHSGGGARRTVIMGGRSSNYPAGIPDKYVGHANLLSDAIRPTAETWHQSGTIRRTFRQPHDAADGGPTSRPGHICRPLVRNRP